ncbi:major facilitator superfamily domain-containing protein 1-like, partial [Limulus polyphemus]|uniref:Lysosomal dipeptide transporter MFSD1 n=1 Tax=Limulus polyphemus TaxID=6850 RepID=A0ABM1S3P1_LIMPO
MREDPVNFSSDDNAPLFHTVIASQYNVNNIINDDNITDVSDESIEHNEGSRTRITASLCDPSHCLHRYSLLFFMCFLGFGSYFCFDNPGALQEQIINDMDITTSQFAQLYSWYSWPNVILSFCGGFLIDKVFGIRLGAIIFSLCILGGQVVFALGGLVDKFWVMEAGRFIFGIGGESLAVAQNTYAVSWFKGKELSMVFGLQLSFARVGSSVNFAVMFPIYELVSKSYEGYKCLGIVLFI